MTAHRYVAFLRGINLGKRRLEMARLRALFEELEFESVTTFIASGNVIFTTSVRTPRTLETHIAGHLEEALGYPVDTFVRTTAQVVEIANRKVFPESEGTGVTIHVGMLQQALPADLAKRLAAIKTAADEFRVFGSEFYWLCRGRSSDSIVWALPEMKNLRLPTMTMRNVTTMRKLAVKLTLNMPEAPGKGRKSPRHESARTSRPPH